MPGATRPPRSGQPLVLSPGDAVEVVRSEATVAIGSGAAEPMTLSAALWSRSAGLRNVRVVCGLLLGGYELTAHPDSFRLSTWFPPGTGAHSGATDYLPLTWRQVPDFYRAVRPDVALVQVSPADADGWHSVGISSSHTRVMIESSTTVIAEVNEHMPYTMGSLVHESELDAVVHTARQLPPFPARTPDRTDELVAAQVAAYVPDGCTLQLGVGSIPVALAQHLAREGRKDLRILGQAGDWLLELAAAGAAPAEGPFAVLGEIGGGPELYRWVAHNPAVLMVEVQRTHTPFATGPGRPVVSVNSALEVDLFGQANSETTDGTPSGPGGGLLDFAIAGQFPSNGVLVIALRSTTSRGRSRIVTQVSGPATVPRALTAIVVTEHGVADLRNLTARERAERLVAIADPVHRPMLRDVVGSRPGVVE